MHARLLWYLLINKLGCSLDWIASVHVQYLAKQGSHVRLHVGDLALH